jgi:hypothetical protein
VRRFVLGGIACLILMLTASACMKALTADPAQARGRDRWEVSR